MSRKLRLTFENDTSSKFWEIEQDGATLTKHWGRIGTTGQAKAKEYASQAAADADYAKEVAAKKKEGYLEATSKAARPAPPPKPVPAVKAAPVGKPKPGPAGKPSGASLSPRVSSEFNYDLASIVDFSSASSALLICDAATLALVDARSGKTLRKFKFDFEARNARLTPDGKRVIAGGYGDETGMCIWDAATGKVVGSAETKGIVRGIAVSADSRRAATCTWAKDVRLWDVVTGKELGGFTLKKSLAYGIALSPDGSLLGCGGTDGIVRVMDPLTGSIQKAGVGKGQILCMDGSLDGRFMASAGKEGAVLIWDWDGNKVHTLTGLSAPVAVADSDRSFLSLSPDGRWAVAAAEKKGDPLVWSLETGKVAATLDGHEGAASVRFSHDSRRIVTADEDTVRVWELFS